MIMEKEMVIGYKWRNVDGKCFTPNFKNDESGYGWDDGGLEDDIKYTFACTFLGWNEWADDEEIFEGIDIDYDEESGVGEVSHIDYPGFYFFEVW
jgi:hypothetical protein